MDDATFQRKAEETTNERCFAALRLRLAMEGKSLVLPTRPNESFRFEPCKPMATEDILEQGVRLMAMYINLLRSEKNFEQFLATLGLLNDFLRNPVFARTKVRDYFCSHCTWSLPNMEALLAIKNFVGDERVWEIAAGNAIWSALLQKLDVQIIATDVALSPDSFTSVQRRSFANVCKKVQPQVLLISWGQSADIDLSLYRGKKLIVIGESHGGCTFNLPVYFYNDEYRLIGESYGFRLDSVTSIPNWLGIYDAVFFYSRD